MGEESGRRQGYPSCYASRLLKFGFPYLFFFRFSFIAPLATSVTAATGCFPISFSAMADWCRCVAASHPCYPTSSSTYHPCHRTHTSIQSVRPINPYTPTHPSMIHSISAHDRCSCSFIFLVRISPWWFIPFPLSQRLSISLRCTVRATVIVYY
jgi:hypothetical protein